MTNPRNSTRRRLRGLTFSTPSMRHSCSRLHAKQKAGLQELALSCENEEDPALALARTWDLLSKDERLASSDPFKRRLNSRCKGFLDSSSITEFVAVDSCGTKVKSDMSVECLAANILQFPKVEKSRAAI